MRIARRLLAAAMCALAALAMCVGLAGTAWGDGATGSITIKNAQKADSYSLYKILDLSYSKDASGNEAFAYTAESGWGSFLDTAKVSVASDAETYFTSVEGPTTGNGSDAVTVKYYQWNTKVEQTAENVQAFAQKALAFAKNSDNGISKVAITGTASADNASVTFSGLDLGYYLIDSSLGAVCALDTNQTDIEIYDKNGAPTVTKEVQENPGSSWGTVNDAGIGDTVNYRVEIKGAKNVLAQGYVLTDTMGKGLTFNQDSLKVYKGSSWETKTELANMADKVVLTLGTTADGATFTLTFNVDNSSIADSTVGQDSDNLYIEYSATVNDDADCSTFVKSVEAIPTEATVNRNTVTLAYGDGKTTEPSITWTNVLPMKIEKYTNVGNTEKVLAGATFKLYSDENLNQVVKFDASLPETDGTKTVSMYKHTSKSSVEELVTPESGLIILRGLDAGTYYLKETKAPAGYNLAKDPIKVVVGHDGKYTVDDDGANTVELVKVLNNTGTELPSTGGMGTTVIYVVGGLLVAAAVVLLVAKKKMSANDK